MGLLTAAAVIGGSYLKDRAAKKAGRQIQKGMQGAIDVQRDPSEILKDFYAPGGMFGADVMSRLLGREKELIPQFQELSRLKAIGGRELQEESKLRQLDLIGQYGDRIRETLEDPRLSKLADTEIAEAERLTAEAAAPLSGERARTAEQIALQGAVRQGRGRGQGAIAQMILGRQGAQDVLLNQAAAARQRARGAVGATRVDPYQFMFSPSAEEQIFSQTPLGAIVTDPGQAINLGMSQDINLGNLLMGKAQAQAQTTAARGAILGNMVSSLGNLAGNAMQPNMPSSMAMQNIQTQGTNLLGQLNQLQGQINQIGNPANYGFTIGAMQP